MTKTFKVATNGGPIHAEKTRVSRLRPVPEPVTLRQRDKLASTQFGMKLAHCIVPSSSTGAAVRLLRGAWSP